MAAMEAITQRYEANCAWPSDINEHLPALRRYAAGCSSVAEFGVRGIVSTWALLKGLAEGCPCDAASSAAEQAAAPGQQQQPQGPAAGGVQHAKRLLCLDIDPIPDMEEVATLAGEVGVELQFVQGDSAKVRLEEEVDLLFIDTWHVYGHLKRELAAHQARVRRFIIMHDTEVDAVQGESIRMGWDVEAQARESGYPAEEITRGMRPALEEFLAANPQWEVAEHFENNNGLTVLRRRG